MSKSLNEPAVKVLLNTWQCTRHTSVGHEYLNGDVLQQVSATEDCTDLVEVPFTVQVVNVLQHLPITLTCFTTIEHFTWPNHAEPSHHHQRHYDGPLPDELGLPSSRANFFPHGRLPLTSWGQKKTLLAPNWTSATEHDINNWKKPVNL